MNPGRSMPCSQQHNTKSYLRYSVHICRPFKIRFRISHTHTHCTVFV